ncbi:phosphatidylethanolamine N-methyltransferase isoform X1 [Bos indicus x Bos taurus]|nr:phosphatidylethanolamine N-methyltransferase isoform X2 [Bos taurus]XP_027372956.1 phosphatidylethanolamine N-methyltransferase isoform X1 [Bos indicus x Bos taurus]
MGPVLGVGGFLEARARSLQGNPRPTSPGRAGPVRSSVAAPDCCGGLGNLDFRKRWDPAARDLGTAGAASLELPRAEGQDFHGFSKADLCIMTRLLGYVDLSEPHFVAAVLAIVFNPLFWNVLHAGHAEPAPDAEPGQPRGLPRGPGTPGSGWRVRPFQFPGAGLHRDLPRRLLRDPQGGQSDHVPVQRPGQPHVLGQHSHLPGLGHCGRQTLTQQGCSQPFPAHLSPTWGPTDRASRWPKQPDVWKPQKVQGAGIPRASARQPERRPSPRHASPTGLLLTALVALIYMVAIVYEEPFTAEIYQQKASQAYKRS